MAALNQGAPSRASYNGGYGAVQQQQLPSGSCNYRDLSIGVRAPTCGCERFWLNVDYGNTFGIGGTEKAWCFCGHHACFHTVSGLPRQTAGEVLSGDASGVAMGDPRGSAQAAFPQAAFPALKAPSPGPAGLGIRAGTSDGAQSINTRLFNALNAFARRQDDDPGSETTSKLPSTACPSVVGEPRLSPSRALLDRMHQARSMGPPINIPYGQPVVTGSDDYSATEVATPSMNGTPDLGFGPSGSITRTSPMRVPQLPEPRPTTSYPEGPVISQAERSTEPARIRPSSQAQDPEASMSLQDVRALLRSLNRRIDVLESLSFSQVPVEEIQEKFEQHDGRLLDLEHWRGDCERDQLEPVEAGPSNGKRRRLLPTETSSFASDGSFDSAAAAHTEAAVLATLAANAETGPRIDALEDRIADLESSSLPSFARPWHIQVVMLPFGRSLRGIWFSALEATQHSAKSSTQLSDEWAGPQAVPRMSFKSSANGAWTTESIEEWANDAQEWLSPKACGPSGNVFQRLASRGLVQDVTLAAPDARHLIEEVGSAFRHALRREPDIERQSGQYQGLQEDFMPLRKARKSSRLRFLSKPEVVTSAVWTAGWLDSSVFMKVNDGQRRLYITTPDAYNQQDSGWTWQELKKLPIFDASGNEQAAQADVGLVEACWSYDDRLDRSLSSHASFATSHEAEWSTRSQASSRRGSEQGNSAQRPPSPVASVRPSHYRAVSMPSSASAPQQPHVTVPGRRVASFEATATARTELIQHASAGAAKRRRSSSPEAERRGAGFTPRWSREPPSPFASEHAGEGQSQGNESRRRGMTPFAYATPHSNSHHAARTDFLGGDGDTEADTEMAVAENEDADDEWQGVEDGMHPDSSPGEGGSAALEPEIEDGEHEAFYED